MTTLYRLLCALLLLFCVQGPTARAAPYVPDALKPWVPWVLDAHPTLPCPVLGGQPVCVWPGRLNIAVRETGGRFSLELRVDRQGEGLSPVALPGGEGAWPQDLRVDGRPATVRAVGGEAPVPTLDLASGSHSVSGTWSWPTLPQGLKLPRDIALVSLEVSGEAVPFPRIEEDGTLRLGGGDTRRPDENRLDLDVSRRVADGVPVSVITRVTLRAAGSGREVNLGAVGLPGTHPVSLEADLPARFTESGELIVQVRPGSFSVTFTALKDGATESLSAPSPGGLWPATEYWAVATDDTVRAVNLSGPPAVDPARTPLPEDWRGLPTFLVDQGATLRFEELRRGEPEPPPNQLSLSREAWLDMDGGGFTFRDHLTGRMSQGWRIDMPAPATLGHVSDHGVDQVITASGAGAGVELRQAQLDLLAESRLAPRAAELPAIGWTTDVQSLQISLNLPPGWTLWGASGVDRVTGALVDDWTLLDLFFVLMVSLPIARLFGARWGLLALAGLALSRQEPDAPALVWVVLLVLAALARVLRDGWVARALWWSRVAATVTLFLILLPFTITQVRTGLFPALERPWAEASGTYNLPSGALDSFGGGAQRAAEIQEIPDRFVQLEIEPSYDQPVEEGYGWRGPSKSKKGFLSLQQDPTAVVQTGPGVPTWSWSQVDLRWSGPVNQAHPMRLWLVGPLGNLVINLLQVGLLVALAFRMLGARLRLPGRETAGAVGLLLAIGLGLARPAAAQDEDLPLAELEARLTAAPSCLPDCASVSTARLSVLRVGAEDRLVVEAEVHAAALASWPVPGPASTWVPAVLTVDGVASTALARQPDGFLYARLGEGVHRIRAEGPLPPTDSLVLQFGLVPRHLTWSGEGWSLDGLRANGTVERAVQLTRTLSAPGAEAASSENLSPWLEVRRVLDLGIPWRVRTEVQRVGAANRPLSIRVPLLPGEAVTEARFEVADGAVLATLNRDETRTEWISTLSESPELTLTAPAGVPWTEQWTVSCSPIYSCAAEGLAPLRHTQVDAEGQERWAPLWRPWPGESLTLRVRRPDAVQGQTATIDQATLTLFPGRRLEEGRLAFRVRTSQGGQQSVRLPEGATLQSVTLNSLARPIQARDGVVPVPLQPGEQGIEISWQRPNEAGVAAAFWGQVPAIDLGSAAVNTTVEVHMPDHRWTLLLFGPTWGPKPMIWSFILVILLAAPLLARLPWAPLRAWQWALLGLGLTQVHPLEVAIVVGWFVLVGARGRRPSARWLVFNLAQLALFWITLAALGVLYHAVATGLLSTPDLRIEGNGSNSETLRWFADRVSGPLPCPVVVSLPMWAWRVAMLLWSLWLAWSLVRWAPWAWRSVSAGGLWRAPPPRATPAKPDAPPRPVEAPSSSEAPDAPPGADQG